MFLIYLSPKHLQVLILTIPRKKESFLSSPGIYIIIIIILNYLQNSKKCAKNDFTKYAFEQYV